MDKIDFYFRIAICYWAFCAALAFFIGIPLIELSVMGSRLETVGINILTGSIFMLIGGMIIGAIAIGISFIRR